MKLMCDCETYKTFSNRHSKKGTDERLFGLLSDMWKICIEIKKRQLSIFLNAIKEKNFQEFYRNCKNANSMIFYVHSWDSW